MANIGSRHARRNRTMTLFVDTIQHRRRARLIVSQEGYEVLSMLAPSSASKMSRSAYERVRGLELHFEPPERRYYLPRHLSMTSHVVPMIRCSYSPRAFKVVTMTTRTAMSRKPRELVQVMDIASFLTRCSFVPCNESGNVAVE